MRSTSGERNLISTSMGTNILNKETRFLCLSQVSETEIYHRLFVPQEPSVCLRLRALQGKKCFDRGYLFKWQERWNNEHDNIKKLFLFVTISKKANVYGTWTFCLTLTTFVDNVHKIIIVNEHLSSWLICCKVSLFSRMIAFSAKSKIY